MRGEGYWIAPSGEIITIKGTHIDEIIENPNKFFLTRDKIEDVYRLHKEPLGLEGKAREEIMTDIIKRGWLRVRFMPKADSFTIQLSKLNKKAKENIFTFATKAMAGIGGDKYNKYVDVKVIDLTGNPLATMNLDQLSKDELYKHSKTAKVITIKEYNPTHKDYVRYLVSKVIDHLTK